MAFDSVFNLYRTETQTRNEEARVTLTQYSMSPSINTAIDRAVHSGDDDDDRDDRRRDDTSEQANILRRSFGARYESSTPSAIDPAESVIEPKRLPVLPKEPLSWSAKERQHQSLCPGEMSAWDEILHGLSRLLGLDSEPKKSLKLEKSSRTRMDGDPFFEPVIKKSAAERKFY